MPTGAASLRLRRWSVPGIGACDSLRTRTLRPHQSIAGANRDDSATRHLQRRGLRRRPDIISRSSARAHGTDCALPYPGCAPEPDHKHLRMLVRPIWTLRRSARAGPHCWFPRHRSAGITRSTRRDRQPSMAAWQIRTRAIPARAARCCNSAVKGGAEHNVLVDDATRRLVRRCRNCPAGAFPVPRRGRRPHHSGQVKYCANAWATSSLPRISAPGTPRCTR